MSLYYQDFDKIMFNAKNPKNSKNIFKKDGKKLNDSISSDIIIDDLSYTELDSSFTGLSDRLKNNTSSNLIQDEKEGQKIDDNCENGSDGDKPRTTMTTSEKRIKEVLSDGDYSKLMYKNASLKDNLALIEKDFENFDTKELPPSIPPSPQKTNKKKNQQSQPTIIHKYKYFGGPLEKAIAVVDPFKPNNIFTKESPQKTIVLKTIDKSPKISRQKQKSKFNKEKPIPIKAPAQGEVVDTADYDPLYGNYSSIVIGNKEVAINYDLPSNNDQENGEKSLKNKNVKEFTEKEIGQIRSDIIGLNRGLRLHQRQRKRNGNSQDQVEDFQNPFR